MPRSGLTLLLFVVGTSSLYAGDPQGKLVYETWDAAFLEGNRAGYVHTTVHKLPGRDDAVYRASTKLKIKVKRFNTVIDLQMDVGTDELADGKVTGVFMRQFLGQAKKLEIQGVVNGKQLELTLDGTKKLQPAPWQDNVVGLYRQQTLFRDKQVKPGDSFQYLSFEPSINLVINTTVNVKDWVDVELFGGKVEKKLLQAEVTPAKVQGVQLPTMTVWLNTQLDPVRSEVEIPGLGKMVLYRTTKTGALQPGSVATLPDIGINQMVPLTKRIANPYLTRKATYRIRIKGESEPSTALSSDKRQSIKKVGDETIDVSIDAGYAPGINGKEISKEFSESNYFINSDDAKVRQIAKSVVANETDAFRKALRIEKWVHANMRGKNYESMATADHVARTLEGDCTEYAMLMAAMCRSAGVPARTAIGLIYADLPNRPAFSFHMWTEVYVQDRWVPLDATLGKGFVGATHIKVTDHSWHDTRSLTPLLPVIRVLGKMSIDVLRTETNPG